MKYAVGGTGRPLEVEVREVPGGGFTVCVGGKEYDVGWNPALGSTHWRLEWAGRPRLVEIEPEGDVLGVTLGIDHLHLRVAPASPLPKKSRGEAGTARTVEVRAPMPGLLVTVEVLPGQAVDGGATLAVIEAMKMQMELRAPAAGRVREVRGVGGREVGAGEVIVVLTPEQGNRGTG